MAGGKKRVKALGGALGRRARRGAIALINPFCAMDVRVSPAPPPSPPHASAAIDDTGAGNIEMEAQAQAAFAAEGAPTLLLQVPDDE